MTHISIPLNRESVILLPEGALWWPDRRLLAVADLHFEKGSSYGLRGQFLPPYDTRATLRRLCELALTHKPATIVALGDSFHDREGPGRLDREDAAQLRALTASHDFVWITGNHDADAAVACGGAAVETYRVGGLTFRHEPAEGDAPGEICGHLHPKASVVVKGRRISRFCFLSDGRRMVMPAFGAFTGGLDAFDPAFFPVFPSGFSAYLLGKGKVYAFPMDSLRAPGGVISAVPGTPRTRESLREARP
jgi:DNA ligase-associated metallophosphoesterase